jgi:hypothetical protein
MIKFIHREYKAILLGALLYGLFFSVTEFLKNYLIDIGNPIDSPYKDILHIIRSILGTITIALPGYVAGRLSVRSGTINGILVMLLCTTASLLILYHEILKSSDVIFSLAFYLSNFRSRYLALSVVPRQAGYTRIVAISQINLTLIILNI